MAAKRISSLMVSLVADVKKYKQGMAEASKVTGDTKKDMESSTKGISASNAAMFSLIQRAVNELINLFKVAIDWAIRFGVAITKAFVDGSREIDETIKRARELGLTTSELQKWQFAADLLGVSTKTVTRAFKQVNRRIGEALLGYGELAVNAKNAGLNMKEFANKTTEQRFMLLVKRLSEMKDKATQAAVAYKFGGRSLTDMINIISQKEGVLLGISDEFSMLTMGVDKMMDEMGVNVENFLDNLRRIKLVLQSVRRAIIINFSGPIASILKQVEISMVGIGRAFEEAKKQAKLGDLFRDFSVGQVNAISSAISDIGGDIRRMAPELVEALAALMEFEKQTGFIKLNIMAIRLSIKFVVVTIKRLSIEIQGITFLLEKWVIGFKAFFEENLSFLKSWVAVLSLMPGLKNLKEADIFKKDKAKPNNITPPDPTASGSIRAASLVEKGTSAAFAAEARAIIGARTMEDATIETANNTRKIVEEIQRGKAHGESSMFGRLAGKVAELNNAGN